MTNAKKAQWICAQMPKGTDYEDVYDVLLGNITQPSDLVDTVLYFADLYDEEFKRKSHD